MDTNILYIYTQPLVNTIETHTHTHPHRRRFYTLTDLCTETFKHRQSILVQLGGGKGVSGGGGVEKHFRDGCFSAASSGSQALLSLAWVSPGSCNMARLVSSVQEMHRDQARDRERGSERNKASGRNQQILLCLAFLARLALSQLLYKESVQKQSSVDGGRREGKPCPLMSVPVGVQGVKP